MSIAPCWFAACGAALHAEDVATAEAYLAALDLAPAPVEGVAGWRAAASLSQRDDWSRDWWQAEETARATLYRDAVAALGENALLSRLSQAMAASAAAIQHAATEALARSGIRDETLSRVAAGAAAQAAYQKSLADAAGCGPDHAFAIKYSLYAAGRWLLGVVGGRCFVF